MKIFTKDWMVFSEYCVLRNIPMNGYHHRLLERVSNGDKKNITPNSGKATWCVRTEKADKVFGVHPKFRKE